jgi:diaminohydroxyphosphoribosylaminopyrimidine deaminase/5-amino-6-(5-phosphoribosylamino)uracil reductase
MNPDKKYMHRAIELAKKGIGFVNPNPLVGAVIVKDDKIIGEGWHAKCGGLHAERNALASCRQSPEGSTIYVTLEPCCHFGKTPPCTDAIIENKIAKVVIGSSDPNPLVSGKGAKIMREHGIEVVTGVLKPECDSLNDIFFHYITTGKPYVIMKYAMTADGKIATVTGDSKWITSEPAREHVHQTRKRVSAIMAGIGTVLSDNPMLDCRTEDPSNPIRIICDSRLKIPLDSKIAKTAKDIPTYIATIIKDDKKIKQLENMGVNIIQTKEKNQRVDLNHLMEYLGSLKIDSVLQEGGAELNYSALQSEIVSKIQVYIAPKIFGGAAAKSPIGGAGVELAKQAYILLPPSVTYLGNDILLEYKMEAKK